jgi:hypothetical protein
MPTTLFRKTLGSSLSPLYDAARDALRPVPVGAVIMVTWKRPRNLKHHNKFFALLDLIFRNQSLYATLDDLRDAITVYVGHAEVMILRDGREVHRPKSIAFHKMDQDQFDQFYAAVIQVVAEKILPGVDQKDLERELLDFIEPIQKDIAA